MDPLRRSPANSTEGGGSGGGGEEGAAASPTTAGAAAVAAGGTGSPEAAVGAAPGGGSFCFQDEFMAGIDGFSLSWREAVDRLPTRAIRPSLNEVVSAMPPERVKNWEEDVIDDDDEDDDENEEDASQAHHAPRILTAAADEGQALQCTPLPLSEASGSSQSDVCGIMGCKGCRRPQTSTESGVMFGAAEHAEAENQSHSARMTFDVR